MTRYKWFQLGIPSIFRSFVKRVEKAKLTSDTLFGFILLGNESDRYRFQYIRRSKISVTILDSKGNSAFQLVDTIESLDFETFQTGDKVWLRMEDPPRSLRDFMNSLEIVTGMGFSAEPVIFPYKQQHALLQCADTCKMVGFKGLGNNVPAKFIARFEVASKEGLVPSDINFLKELNYKIDHATFDVGFNMLKGQITFASSGIVRITGALEPYLLNCVESYLPLNI